MSSVQVTRSASLVQVTATRPQVAVGTPSIVSASAVPFTPAGGIAATNVQAAIAELDAEKQPLDAELSALAALTSAADQLPYFTGLGTAALTTLTAFGRSLIAAADAPAAKVVLGLGLLASSVSGNTATIAGTLTEARNYTLPDASMTFAGQNIDNAFSIAQTFAGSMPGTPSAGQVLIGGGAIKASGAITAGGVVSSQGLQNTVGDFTSRADEDAQTILGRIRCGFFTGLGDNAAFAHYDFATSSSYALRQDASGATVLNSASGQNLRLSIANTAVLTVTATALTAAQPLTVPNGTAAAPGIKTADNHGLFRKSSTAIGMAAAGAESFSAYAPNGSSFGGALGLSTPSAAEGGLISATAATSFVCYSGGSTVNVGGWTRAYGQTHATKANFVEFGRGASTVSAYFDSSGIFTLNNTTDASAIGTAAIVGLGGASIAKSLWVGGTAGNYINIANSTGELRVNGTKVLGAQGAAVADASGGATVDAEARTAINTLLARLRTHGLILT